MDVLTDFFQMTTANPTKLVFDDEGNAQESAPAPVEIPDTEKLQEKLRKKQERKRLVRDRMRESKFTKATKAAEPDIVANVLKADDSEKEIAAKNGSAPAAMEEAAVQADDNERVAGESETAKRNDDTVETTKDTAEESVVSKAKQQALAYLDLFIEDKPNWKFNKLRQTWILRNLYYQNEMDHAYFKLALQYMKNMGQKAKSETIDEAKILLDKLKPQLEGSKELDVSSNIVYKRCKKVLKYV